MSPSTQSITVERQRFPLRLLDTLIAHQWVSLAVVAVIASAAHFAAHDWSWHYIQTGVHALFSPSGWRLYSEHPELQMGPATFIAGAVFVLFLHPGAGTLAADAFMMLIGLLAVREISSLAAPQDIRGRRRWFISSILVVAAWSEVAVHWGHLDDALALFGGVLAIRLIRSGHPFWSTVVIGLAIDFKPWAVPFAAILLIAPRRRWIALAGVVAIVVVVAWGGFLLFDPATASAAHFRIPVNPASTLGLFGVSGGTPSWCRPAQLLGGLVLAAIATRRERWPAVLMVVIALRLLLDPEVKNYYDSGLILATALFDVAGTVTLLPVLTLLATIAVYLPSYLLAAEPPVRALVRTVVLLGFVAVGVFATPRALRETGAPSEPAALSLRT